MPIKNLQLNLSLNMKTKKIIKWLSAIVFCFSFVPGLQAAECVVLLHGLARGAGSMDVLDERLSAEGYTVINKAYPSREKSIEALSRLAIDAALDECRMQKAAPVNFVTHSMGGILVRQYYAKNSIKGLNRVVMLGPPNGGSEIIDRMKEMPGFEKISGPAGQQLRTDNEALPNALGKVEFDLGVIAGTQSVNVFLSLLLPGEDDGKVTVASAKVAGMNDFIAMPTTHPFMMKNTKVIDQVLSFLKTGKFFAKKTIKQ